MNNPLEKLKQLLTPKAEYESYYQVNAIAKHYPGYIKTYEPRRPGKKLFEGLESYSQIAKVAKLYKARADDDNEDRAVRRAKSIIRDVILCNPFELWATFTFNPEKTDRYNIQLCKKQMMNWLKNQQYKNGKFEYLIVPEYHKDGALHFHALIKNYTGALEPATDDKTGKQIKQRGRKVFRFPGYTLGFTNVKQIEATPESYSTLATYISKYVTKDMLNEPGKKRYWHSKQLEMPRVEYNPPDWYKTVEPDWSHESEFGITKIFSSDKLKGLI